ncbi:MAG: lysylphosphatidylglycerol synthase domain-containing protein [Desulfobaccales bacterium]
MRKLNLILVAIALVFLIWIMDRVGWATLGQNLLKVGWYWPLLLLPYGLVNLLEAISWRFILVSREHRPSLSRLFWLRLGGEALNQLTPTASLGGEPFKAAGLHAGGTSWDEATASVVIHKGILVLSLALYIFLGLALAPLLLSGASSHLVILSLAALGLAAAGGAFVFAQRQAPCATGIRLLDRIGFCPAALKEKEETFNNVDARMAGFYREYPGRCFLALVLFFFSWMLHSVEVYLMFWLLGHPIGWDLAICLDALAMLFTALGFFIPAAAGVQEGGNILLSLGFDLGMVLGVAFSILRRLREAFWLSLGLIAVSREK